MSAGHTDKKNQRQKLAKKTTIGPSLEIFLKNLDSKMRVNPYFSRRL